MAQVQIEFPAGKQERVSERTGNPYWVQEGYALTLRRDGSPEPYPVKFTMFVREKSPGVKPGRYVLAPDAVHVDNRGNLVVSPDRLIPVPAASTPVKGS